MLCLIKPRFPLGFSGSPPSFYRLVGNHVGVSAHLILGQRNNYFVCALIY